MAVGTMGQVAYSVPKDFKKYCFHNSLFYKNLKIILLGKPTKICNFYIPHKSELEELPFPSPPQRQESQECFGKQFLELGLARRRKYPLNFVFSPGAQET